MLGKLIEHCGLESPIPHAMAMDAIFAGMDTTGNTSSFIFYLLAANPEEQEMVYQNIMEKLPAGGEHCYFFLKFSKDSFIRGFQAKSIKSGCTAFTCSLVYL